MSERSPQPILPPGDEPAGPCAECGQVGYQTNYLRCEELARMERDGLCFNCAFWSLKAERRDPLVVKGVMYVVGREDERSGWRGFGGARFNIEYLDGRSVTSSNVWCNGHVPAHFRDRLPDTARFVAALGPSAHDTSSATDPLRDANT